MYRKLRRTGLYCGLLLSISCGGGSAESAQTNSTTEAEAGAGGDPSACGSKVCKPGAFAFAIDAGVTCCVDPAEGLCGVEDRTGACRATKTDSRCPDFMTSVGLYTGCCTDDNQCGLFSNGLSGYGCLPLSEPILRDNETDVPEPKACDEM